MSAADDLEVVNNEAAGRFEIALGGQTAFAEYRLLSDGILFPHTVVPRAFEGRGIASRLARAALAYARDRSLKVMPDCSFFVDYLRKHPEFHDLVHPDYRAAVGAPD